MKAEAFKKSIADIKTKLDALASEPEKVNGIMINETDRGLGISITMVPDEKPAPVKGK